MVEISQYHNVVEFVLDFRLKNLMQDMWMH